MESSGDSGDSKKRKLEADNNNNIRKSNWQSKWVKTYGDWLICDEEKQEMFRSLCRERKFNNTMTLGASNCKTTRIDRHLKSLDHRTALAFPNAKQNLNISVENAETKQ